MEEIRGDRITIRTDVTASDAVVPVAAQTAFNSHGSRFALIEASLIGTCNPSATITPLYWQSAGGFYMKGVSSYMVGAAGVGTDVKQRELFIVPIYGYTDFYVLVDGLAGTSPNVNITAIPYSY